ncbi:hypothetical protein B296_00020058 [Ensete ventricosum]|uniref:Uncharacterized protein n=1 Tax=Ensete ventricosum TaxID=4639 RepID=A0A426XXS2_ENSVE|nr:hypothetical protein B296_00020058 [Ensete ventricosum]
MRAAVLPARCRPPVLRRRTKGPNTERRATVQSFSAPRAEAGIKNLQRKKSSEEDKQREGERAKGGQWWRQSSCCRLDESRRNPGRFFKFIDREKPPYVKAGYDIRLDSVACTGQRRADLTRIRYPEEDIGGNCQQHA